MPGLDARLIRAKIRRQSPGETHYVHRHCITRVPDTDGRAPRHQLVEMTAGVQKHRVLEYRTSDGVAATEVPIPLLPRVGVPEDVRVDGEGGWGIDLHLRVVSGIA